MSGVCCQVEVSDQADHLTRGVLLSVLCPMRVIVKSHKGRPGPRIGPKCHGVGGKKIVLRIFYKCFLPGYCKKQKTAYTPETFCKNVLK